MPLQIWSVCALGGMTPSNSRIGTVQLKKVLFTTTVTVDGTPHLLAVHDVRHPRQLKTFTASVIACIMLTRGALAAGRCAGTSGAGFWPGARADLFLLSSSSTNILLLCGGLYGELYERPYDKVLFPG